eukprot:5904490-Prymnesium_polylepis.2
MEAATVQVPTDDTLARTVIRMEDKAAEERQLLKARHIRVAHAMLGYASASSCSRRARPPLIIAPTRTRITLRAHPSPRLARPTRTRITTQLKGARSHP